MSAKALAGLAFLGVLATNSVGETLVSSSVYVEPQSLIAIDGTRRLNFYCVGSGRPTVLLDAPSRHGGMCRRRSRCSPGSAPMIAPA
jgi:hypothetical protein